MLLPERRNKRRNKVIDAIQGLSLISVSGEGVSKRRRETSIESVDFTSVSARKKYLTEVRISVRVSPPTRTMPTPRAPPGESTPYALSGESSDETLTPSTASEDTISGSKPTTRSMTVREPSERESPKRHEILRVYRDLTSDPLALLVKANASELYEPQIYKEVMADVYRKMN